jgi:hypothetical protein
MERLVSRANSANVAMATAITVIASAALLGLISEAWRAPDKGVATWSLRGDVSSREPRLVTATPG